MRTLTRSRPIASESATRRSATARRRTRFTAGFASLAAVATLGVGVVMGQGQAAAALNPLNPSEMTGTILDALINNKGSQTLINQWRTELCASGGSNGGADCTGSNGTGVAIVLPEKFELAPDFLYKLAQALPTLKDAPVADGSAKVIGDGFQFALASGGGNATAISYLPVSLATAGASGGRTAFSFALIGLATAWTTDAIPFTFFGANTGSALPGVKSVGCYGGLTLAYAEDVGACANVLGTFDFRLDQLQSIPQVQFALTDPTALLSDPTGVLGDVITDIFNDETPTLSKDFVRLSLGGDALLALTSDYGLTKPVTINWLGSEITLYSTVTINTATTNTATTNEKARPNYLALPVIALGEFNAGQIVPVLSIPTIEFPFGIPSAGPYTSETAASATTTLASTPATRALTAATSEAETTSPAEPTAAEAESATTSPEATTTEAATPEATTPEATTPSVPDAPESGSTESASTEADGSGSSDEGATETVSSAGSSETTE